MGRGVAAPAASRPPPMPSRARASSPSTSRSTPATASTGCSTCRWHSPAWRWSPSSAAAIAVRHEAMFTAIIGLVGGLATPVLLSTGVDRPVGFFSYLLVLAVGFLFVAERRQWPVLTILAAIGTSLLELGWYASYMAPEKLVVGLAGFTGHRRRVPLARRADGGRDANRWRVTPPAPARCCRWSPWCCSPATRDSPIAVADRRGVSGDDLRRRDLDRRPARAADAGRRHCRRRQPGHRPHGGQLPRAGRGAHGGWRPAQRSWRRSSACCRRRRSARGADGSTSSTLAGNRGPAGAGRGTVRLRLGGGRRRAVDLALRRPGRHRRRVDRRGTPPGRRPGRARRRRAAPRRCCACAGSTRWRSPAPISGTW